jgi:uncharacterized membrane protein
MSAPKQATSLERWVRWTLLSGVALSGVLLVLGLLLAFMRHEPRPEGPPLGLGVLIRSALLGNGLSITNLALLVLMITPLLRVSVLAAGWALAGQPRFALVALVVLCLLGLGVVLGVG